MRPSAAKEIERWRERIDELDRVLVELLNKRTKYAIEIGKVKDQHGIDIYDAVREEEVIHNVQSATAGPLTEKAVQRLFERIIDETRRSEREFRAALKTEADKCSGETRG